jgi:hypothetical protein
MSWDCHDSEMAMHGNDRFGKAAVRLAILSAVCLWALPASAQQFPAKLLGAWQLNLDKSTYDPGPPPVPPATNVTTIEKVGTEVRMTVDNVNAQGETNHTITVMTLDGKENPVQGMKGVTRSFRLIDANSFEWTQKSDSRPPSTTKVVLSADSKTVSVTSTANNNTLVFDRKK